VIVYAAQSSGVLIVTTGRHTCAIPLHHISETMRPLPVEPLAGTPRFVRGASVIRGAPTPVVDLGALLERGENGHACGRFVTVKAGVRRVALAVDAVVGVRSLDSARLEELPPLLRDADADLIEAIATSDMQLLVVLRTGRIVPDQVWAVLATELG
jgi:purine-binding chemotaxis protein CheW